VEQLLHFDIDHGEALHTALQFFSKDEVRYVAIDGAGSLDEQLDLLVSFLEGLNEGRR
jgi:hypothetical protein